MNGALPSAACLSACLSARPALATAAAAAVSTPLPEREREREGGEREGERERERERDLGGGSIGSSDSSPSFSLSRSVHLSKTHSSPLFSSYASTTTNRQNRAEATKAEEGKVLPGGATTATANSTPLPPPPLPCTTPARTSSRAPACLSACLTTAASELCLCLILVPTDLTDCGVRRGGEEGRRGRQSC